MDEPAISLLRSRAKASFNGEPGEVPATYPFRRPRVSLDSVLDNQVSKAPEGFLSRATQPSTSAMSNTLTWYADFPDAVRSA